MGHVLSQLNINVVGEKEFNSKSKHSEESVKASGGNLSNAEVEEMIKNGKLCI